MPSPRYKAYFYMLIVVLIWGLAVPVIKFTLSFTDPIVFLTARFLVSTLLVLPFWKLLKINLPQTNSLKLQLFAYGTLTSTLVLGLLFIGLTKTTALNASLITAISPLLVAVAGARMLNEHVTTKEKLGMAVALVGTIITVIGPLGTTQSSTVTGNLLIFVYLIGYTLSAIYTKKLTRLGISPTTLSQTTFISGLITILPFTMLTSPNIVPLVLSLPLEAILGIIYMALLSGNLAYLLWTKAQKRIEVGEVALFSYLIPVISTPIAIIWLKESVNKYFVFGTILIVIGLIIAQIKTNTARIAKKPSN